MMQTDLQNYLIHPGATVRDAMERIDKNTIGIAFIVDQNLILQAVVSDGDIRRALLKGESLDSNIMRASNSNPIVVFADTPTDELNKIMAEKKIRVLPIVDAEKRILDFIQCEHFFPVAQSIFKGNELKYVMDAVLSGWVSSSGPYVTAFESDFVKFCGVKYAVSCSNGTAALHLALLALGIGPCDEVIVPSLTFISSANAIRFVGASPVFVDSELNYWQMDAAQIEAAITPKTKAIIVVHLYGHPSKMDEIMNIAKKYNLLVIEDTAEAMGAEFNGQKVGGIGDIGTFSFFGNKIITTGEGGMITTNNEEIAKKILKLRDHGMSKERRYFHDVLGYNYRLTNLQAGLGVAQLERIDEILEKKIKIAGWYNSYLAGIKGVNLHCTAPWAKNVFWMYSIVVEPSLTGMSRDVLIVELKKHGVDTRPFFMPVHKQPIYSEHGGKVLQNAELLSETGINLPSSVGLRELDVAAIANKIRSIIERFTCYEKHISF